jgi:hypothetical protein
VDERKNLPDDETLNTNPEGIAQARFTEKKLLNSTEATRVVASLLSDLIERGLDAGGPLPEGEGRNAPLPLRQGLA